MKTQYQFVFEQLTVGDAAALVEAAKGEGFGAFVRIADRYTVGGMLTLPYTELQNVIDQFAKAFVAHTQTILNPDVARLLRQALGGGNADT